MVVHLVLSISMGGEHHITSRRRVLTSVAGATIAAGCSAVTKEASVSRIHLGLIKFLNVTAQPRTIEVVVERDGDIVHWSEFKVKPDTEQIVLSKCAENPPWEGKGKYIVHAREEQSSSWVTIDTVAEAKQQKDYTDSSHLIISLTFKDSRLSYAIRPGQMDCQ